ncbi:MAG: nucleoside diphosphate kinase regulator [Phycisphaerae bacterium]
MTKLAIYMTVEDMACLGRLLISAAAATPDESVRALDEKMDGANFVRPEEIRPDVVTMNSKVRTTNLDSGEEHVFTLVFPEDADERVHKVSVLDPVGVAVLGYRVGDEIGWKTHGSTLNLRIEEVMCQPEDQARCHR